ncbi:ribonuclease BN [Caulobacter sp. CCUG 60055]|uniref:YihY/virulence factor BrkB family protein n=1 Tax=Caulobacter sp. CCUG 60055 TaxID=2100090 RepID=UPI001FA7D377|nr:YihY/virulence factor BrkB family protein [Caulobacter sp. CCUG 60055]MCI3180534.1 ribonuclease BN [Caulobacter sp. CCUG 60055]
MQATTETGPLLWRRTKSDASKPGGPKPGAGDERAGRRRDDLGPLDIAALAALVGLVVFIPNLQRGRSPKAAAGRLSEGRLMSPEAFEAAEPGRGRMARTPHHIPLRGWRDVLWRTYREIGVDRLPAVAGGVTFYALLAIFPALGVFVSLYGLFADLGAVEHQLDQMSAVFPPSVVDLVGDQMVRLATQKHESLSLAFVISLLLSLWSANAGMKALFDGLNVAYNETEKRGFMRRTAITLGFTLAAIVFLALVTALLVAAPLALHAAGLPPASSWWIPLRWGGVAALTAGVFCAIYRFGPSRRRPRWRWVAWGAAFATAFWLLGSLGFSWYVNNVAHYDVTYGSLGAAIGFMMWIWFSVMAVLLGAELNAEVEHQTAVDTTCGADRPMGERGAAMADSVGLAFHFRPVSFMREQADGLMRRLRPNARPVSPGSLPAKPGARPDPRRSAGR